MIYLNTDANDIHLFLYTSVHIFMIDKSVSLIFTNQKKLKKNIIKT